MVLRGCFKLCWRMGWKKNPHQTPELQIAPLHLAPQQSPVFTLVLLRIQSLASNSVKHLSTYLSILLNRDGQTSVEEGPCVQCYLWAQLCLSRESGKI